MQKKKILSAIICAAMLASGAGTLPAYADKADTKTEKSGTSESAETAAMKKAMLEVKKRCDIPAKLDKFDYDTETRYETTYYRFRWYREEKDKYDRMQTAESVTVEYYKGFISAYNHYIREDGSGKPHFSKLSVSEQDACAKKYLTMLNPSMSKEKPIIERSDGMSLFGSTADYSIRREEYGIGFLGSNCGSISIDRDTGMLMSYYLEWWRDADIPDAAKRLSVKEVSDIYASRKPLKAYYDLFHKYKYDEQTGSYTVTPFVLAVYEPKVGGEDEIDALTGKYTSMYDDMKKYSHTDAYTWGTGGYEDDEVWAGEGLDEDYEAEEAPAPAPFNEAELAALEKENKYISYEKALKIIKDDKYIIFNDGLVLEENRISSYTDEKGESQPSRQLRFRSTTDDDSKDNIYLTAELDAFTGKIISFSKSYYYGRNSKNSQRPEYSKSASVKLANEAAKHFIGDRADKYVYNDNAYWTDKTPPNYKTLRYTRHENGLPAVFDTMSIDVNSDGEVLGFSHVYHDIKFPAANLVTEEQAYNKLFEKMKPTLLYNGFTDLQLKPHVYLTYMFESNYLINAVTGQRINSYGEAYYSNDKNPDTGKEPKLYTDIKGHKYEKEITSLYDHGIRITDEAQLHPDEAITIGEFIRIYNISKSWSRRLDGLYPDIGQINEQTGKTEYVRNPMLDKPATYKEIARMYLYAYENDLYPAAEIEGIFAPPFGNIKTSDKYCGYIAVAKAKGLLKSGEGKDTFDMNKCITKGSCLKMLYDYYASDGEAKELYEIITI